MKRAKNIPSNVTEEADEVVEVKIQPPKQITEKVQLSIGEVEAMISAKVRSLSKPHSG